MNANKCKQSDTLVLSRFLQKQRAAKTAPKLSAFVAGVRWHIYNQSLYERKEPAGI